MKRTLLKLMRRSGVFVPFRLVNRNKVLILTYHRFSDVDDGRSTTSRAFADQLAYLKAHYSILPLSRIAKMLSNGSRMPASVAAITIDDGFRDSYEIAYPILRDFGVPATVFVVTHFVDKKAWLWTDKLRYLTGKTKTDTATLKFSGRYLTIKLNAFASRLEVAARINSILKTLPDKVKDEAIEEIAITLGLELPKEPPAEYAPVSWEQLCEMDSHGLEIGSHTVTHPILTNTSDGQLGRELRDSRARLEEVLGRTVKLFCYPNGSFDQRVRSAVANAGYECAVTTELGLNGRNSDLLALHRVAAELDLDHFVQSTSGFEEVKMRLFPERI